MDFPSIQNFVCAKVSKTDDYSRARCLDFIMSRDKLIYESADWKAAQIIVEKTISAGGGTTTEISIPEVHHTLATRLDGNFIDPVTASYIFENSTSVKDNYLSPGTPLFYDEFMVESTGVKKLRFFPPLADDGNAHTLVVLGKAPYDATRTTPLIPQTEQALIAFVLGDMWEYLHQVGKGQAKFQEATTLLQAAQQADTPAALRPRKSKVSTPAGNSLGELSYAVCAIIDDFAPNTISNIKDRMRRRWQAIWDYCLWPESTVVASVQANGSTAILPHLIDKVIGVRINLPAPLNVQTLDYADASIFFGIRPDVFEQTGNPLNYSLLLPVAIPTDLGNNSMLNLILSSTSIGIELPDSSSETAMVFIRGEVDGADIFETVTVNLSTPVTTTKAYDTVFTISKPVTINTLQVQDLIGTPLTELGPTEQDRKHVRIRLYPAFDTGTDDQTVFVLGKRKLPQLLDDGDICQLSSVENILINGVAADMLLKSGKSDVSAKLSAQADSDLQTLVDRETKQSTYAPRVLPYTEQSNLSVIDSFFIG